VQHICLDCGKPHPTGFHPFCTTCGGMVDVTYDAATVKLADSPNPYVRFAALLPLTESAGCLPAASYTPVVHATRLGRELGMDSLYLKDETSLPTRSTKDRMAAVALAYLHERGVRAFCASSTGNSSTSFAYRMPAFPDMHLFLFSGEYFVPRVQHADHDQVTHFGLREASFVDAAEYANRYAKIYGLTSEGGFFNPGRREGLKLAFLEATEQVPQPIDWYVQAVSSAMGVYGTYKGAKELLQIDRLKRLPRLLCVQQASCAPMVRAYEDGSETIRAEHRVAMPTGIAEAILRGDPTRAFPHVRRIVVESRGSFVMATEVQIRRARQLVEDHEGISPCFSAAAAVAGLIEFVRANPSIARSTVVINLTGADRPDTEAPAAVHWVPKTEQGWSAEALARV
jgi:threonine synthase